MIKNISKILTIIASIIGVIALIIINIITFKETNNTDNFFVLSFIILNVSIIIYIAAVIVVIWIPYILTVLKSKYSVKLFIPLFIIAIGIVLSPFANSIKDLKSDKKCIYYSENGTTYNICKLKNKIKINKVYYSTFSNKTSLSKYETTIDNNDIKEINILFDELFKEKKETSVSINLEDLTNEQKLILKTILTMEESNKKTR